MPAAPNESEPVVTEIGPLDKLWHETLNKYHAAPDGSVLKETLSKNLDIIDVALKIEFRKIEN
jgi:hypothetical protein